MTQTLFPVPANPTVPVQGEKAEFPVRRIFCVGRNYAEHAKEMGNEVDREAPFLFMKDASALVPTGASTAYAPGTTNLHYEMEFVVALSAPLFKATADEAAAAIYGYACGLDMTRRDLQAVAKDKGRPWDFAKNFEQSAPITPIVKAADFGKVGGQRIWLSVDGTVKQDSTLSEMIFSPVEVLVYLSGFYHLQPGDLVFTGTPAGVGAVKAGNRIEGGVDGLPNIELTITPAE